MDRGHHPGRPLGILLLGLGIAVELVGTALLVLQDQDVYTIDSSVTLPSWGAMLVGIALVAVGYGRLLRSVGPRSMRFLASAGASAGSLLFSAALAWQIAVGLIPSGDLDLDVDAVLPLFFIGVAALALGVRSLSRTGAALEKRGLTVPPPPASSTAVIFGRPAAVAAVGVAFLVTSGAAAGWLNSQAADVNSLYQLVALELAAGGAWLLLSGTMNLLDLVPEARRRDARRVGMVAGLVFLVAGAAAWWWTAPLVYALGEILLGGFLLAGVGLLLLCRPKGAKARIDL